MPGCHNCGCKSDVSGLKVPASNVERDWFAGRPIVVKNENRAGQIVPGPSHRKRRSRELSIFSTAFGAGCTQEKETAVLNKTLVGISLGVIGMSLLLPCDAAAPAKIASVAPIADLVAEADAKIKSLDEALASDKSYLEAKGTTIPTEAGVLAVLAQAVVESEEKAPWQASAADVREAAKSVAAAKSYDEAKKGLTAVKEAYSGKTGGAKPEAEWNQLAGLSKVMKEVNKRNTKLRRTTRKKPPTDDDFAEAARDASVMAVLALAAHEDTHEVKSGKAEDIAEWKKFAKEFQAEMTAASAAFKKKDLAAAGDAFKKGNTACNDCHMKYRPNE